MNEQDAGDAAVSRSAEFESGQNNFLDPSDPYAAKYLETGEHTFDGPIPRHVVEDAVSRSRGGRVLFHGSRGAASPDIAKIIAKRGLSPQNPGIWRGTKTDATGSTWRNTAVFATPEQKVAVSYATLPVSPAANRAASSARPYVRPGKVYIIDADHPAVKAQGPVHKVAYAEVPLNDVPKEAILWSGTVGIYRRSGEPYRLPQNVGLKPPVGTRAGARLRELQQLRWSRSRPASEGRRTHFDDEIAKFN